MNHLSATAGKNATTQLIDYRDYDLPWRTVKIPLLR